MLHVTYLIILLPLVGFAVQLLAGRRLGDPLAGAVATAFIGASFVVSVGVYLDLLTVHAPVRTFTQNLWTWIPVGPAAGPGQPLRRSAVDDHGAVRHRHQSPDPPLLHRLHEGRPGLPEVLPLHEPVRGLDADPGAGQQHAGHLRRVGGGGDLLLLAGLVLVHPGLGGQCRQEGLRLQPDRGRRLPAGHLPGLRQGSTRSSTPPSSPTSTPSAPATSPPSASCSWWG